MNSKQLHYFITTVNKGSIAAAARELDIAQPGVSQQLANLEREIGVALLNRSHQGISLTTAGEVFWPHALTLVQDINDAKAAIQEHVLLQPQVVNVAVLPSIGNVVSLPLLEQLQRRYPQIEIVLSTGPSYSVQGWLESGQVDLGLTYEHGINSNAMRLRPLLTEQLYLVSSPCNTLVNDSIAHESEVPFWQISQFELLSPGPKDALGKLIHHYEARTGVELHHSKSYSGQLMTGLRQVMKGEGVMILPSSAVFHLELQNLVKTYKITQPNMTRVVYAAYSNSRPLHHTELAVLKVIQDVVKDEMETGHWRGQLPS